MITNSLQSMQLNQFKVNNYSPRLSRLIFQNIMMNYKKVNSINHIIQSFLINFGKYQIKSLGFNLSVTCSPVELPKKF